MRKRSAALAAAVLVGAALAGAVATALLARGGPPPAEPAAGVKEYRPVAESWRLVATGPPRSGVLCTHGDPCNATELARAAAGGAVCAWTGRVWLSAEDVPVVARGVNGTAFAVAWRGDGQALSAHQRNVSSHESTFPAPWGNGWWWRAASERVELTVPLPCDTHTLAVNLNYGGTTLAGGSWASSQELNVALLPPPADGDA